MADLNEKLSKFCRNMSELEQMSAHFSNFYFELMEEPDNNDNVWNKLDANITFVFANTSFYWLYLLLKETDLADHPIKDELNRVRKYMQEYLLLKKDAPKLNIKVAKSYIRNALWDPTNVNTNNNDNDSTSLEKRKDDDDEQQVVVVVNKKSKL